ncbi:MAG: ATP-dependent DNA helicase, partial [Gammaproteobacteria bacterium]|nr:ATP-dependent DNA helicase [Gammaproteobacteria bacterium]
MRPDGADEDAGFTTRRGRHSLHVHYDAVNRRLRGRLGARLTAITNGGAIPDQFDYDVMLLPEELPIGTVNEDFAFESLPGDIFQLGNSSYRILRVETGRVLVEDAQGQPPNIPFWFGEAPGRSEELSVAVSRLRRELSARLEHGVDEAQRWLVAERGLSAAAAGQLVAYLGAARAALGELPTQETIVLERFFDEVGDSHLVIHSVFGSRINRAWGLALRKRFCRRFNYELQAAALDDSIVISLGPVHSFPLAEVAGYLQADTVRNVLVQALLAAPMFPARWRWVATTALALRRFRNGRKVPPQFQRSDAEDLLAVVFPDQIACAENIVGDRQVPDHPLVGQTLTDCLDELMDIAGLESLLRRIETGAVRIEARDVTTPSPLAQEILSARPFAFLDDAPAEERRTRAVRTRHLLDVQ